jgi:segregation and condensation protein B
MNEFVLPELKQIVGAMLFVRKEPLTVAEIRRVLSATAERRGGITTDFAKANETLIREAVDELGRDLADRKVGFHIIEVAGGFRLENDANCGPWLRVMLQKGRGTRLSLPALETLAIVAYRQPCVRSEIEAVRGVAVDAILKNLLELQLVRVVGRSELPGRPWMFGTTQKFMEHFGLKSLDDLPGTDELRRMEARQTAKGRKEKENPKESPVVPLEDSSSMKIDSIEKGEAGEPAQEAALDGDGDRTDDEVLFEREALAEEDIVGGEDEEVFDPDEEDEEFDEDDDEEDDFDEDEEEEEDHP